MVGIDHKISFHLETARKRVKELIKETNSILAEGGGNEIILSDFDLNDNWNQHIRFAIEWNAITLQKLDLSFNKFTDSMMHSFDDIPSFLSLKELNLSSNNFTDGSSESIVRLLGKTQILSKINFSLNHFGKILAKGLALSSISKSILILDLSSNKFGDDGCDILCHALASRKSMIQHLNLSMNQLTDASSPSIAGLLASCATLHQLILSGNSFGDYGASAIAFSIDKCPGLEELYMDSNMISFIGIKSFLNILRSNPDKIYKILSFDSNPVDLYILDELNKKRKSMILIKQYQLPPSNNRIDLNGSDITPVIGTTMDNALCKDAIRLIRSFPQLLQVHLSHNSIGDSGAFDIGFYLALNPRLLLLDLSHNIITDRGACGLTQGLLVNSSLREFNINCNRIGDEGVSNIYATCFDNKKSALSIIHVQGNQQSMEGDAIVDAIIQSKDLAKQLRQGMKSVLDFADRDLRRFGADVLYELLEHDSTCQVLNLCRNGIGDDGAKSIASLLCVNSTITKLDISCNGIGDVGAKALAEMLQVNCTLLALNLRAAYGTLSSEKTISESGMMEINTALQLNKGLQVVDLRDHCTTKRIIASWVQVLRVNPIIQKFNGTEPASFLARYS